MGSERRAITNLFLLLMLCVLPFGVASAAAPEGDRVLATVNGQQLTMSDYRRFLLKIGAPPTMEGVDGRLLKKAVEERLILQEALRQGIHVSDEEVEKSLLDFLKENNLTRAEFEKQVAEQRMTSSDYKKWLKENIIVLVKIIDREVNGRVTVSERETRDYYDRNRERYRVGQEKVRLKAIVLKFHDKPTAAEATYLEIRSMDIREALRKGGSFEKLEAVYSEDEAAKVRGYFGEFRKGELLPAVEKRLLHVKEGGVGQPILLNQGLYIFKVVKRQGEKFAPFESVKENIRSMLLQQKQDERYSAWVRSLWEKSDIEMKIK
jgi:parvulin-like peptidyl-prolyl isomerase